MRAVATTTSDPNTPVDLKTPSPVRTRGWSWQSTILPPVALSLVIIVAWEILVIAFDVSQVVLPAPSSVAAVSITEVGTYLEHARVTAVEVLLGFILATVTGLTLGAVIALSRHLGAAIYPLLIASQVTPKVAIAPLMLIWFGFGIGSKVVLTALIAFFPIVISTVVGLNMTTRDGIDLFRNMGASPRQTFVKLRFPNALPVIMSGIKLAATFSVIGAVVGEFAGARAGLGFLLVLQAGQLKMASAFGNIVYLTILGLVMFGAISAIERLIVPAHMLKRDIPS